jgi:predicted extracellular nuclease
LKINRLPEEATPLQKGRAGAAKNKRVMRKTVYLLLFALVATAFAGYSKGGDGKYVVMFYNLENLFDTLKSQGVLDGEYLPSAAKGWNSQKYWKKNNNMCEVVRRIAEENATFPTIIGVSEIENRNVLEDIAANPKLAKANYRIVHYDSPDYRGVDVALLYRPDQFKLLGSRAVPVDRPGYPNWKTRDVLMAWGTIEGETFCFMVNHWPSRRGGQEASEHLRVLAASVAKHAADSIMQAMPGIKVVIMGDLNDDPIDKSVLTTLGAGGDAAATPATGLFNPFLPMFRRGYGTLAYDDQWNLFDNIIVSGEVANGPGLKLYKPSRNKYYGNIFDRPFLKQTEGQYKHYPLRTFIGDNFMNGYSDHFPVFIIIK